jgi:hypothetical protein
MDSVAVTAPPVEQPAVFGPPVRHGKCRLILIIGGTSYSLRPIPQQPRGYLVWSLRVLDGDRAGKNYCVAIAKREAGCTCPDMETNGAVCKHVAAMRALGFLPVSCRTAGEIKAEAARIAANKARRAKAPAAAPAKPLSSQITPPVAASGPDPLARARRRHKPDRPSGPVTSLPTPTVAGWHQAVNAHVAQLQGVSS